MIDSNNRAGRPAQVNVFKNRRRKSSKEPSSGLSPNGGQSPGIYLILLFTYVYLDNTSTPLGNYSPDETITTTNQNNGMDSTTNPMLNAALTAAANPTAVAAAFSTYGIPAGFPTK